MCIFRDCLDRILIIGISRVSPLHRPRSFLIVGVSGKRAVSLVSSFQISYTSESRKIVRLGYTMRIRGNSCIDSKNHL